MSATTWHFAARIGDLSHRWSVAALGGVAGESSQRKYDELSRSWRRRKRRFLVGLTVVCGGVVLMTFLGAERWPSGGWLFGVVGGAALSFAVVLPMSPPGWIENWQLGAWGEQATGNALKPLEAEGWIVMHDLPAGRGNVDHVAVGPGGVYLLDTKRLGGSVATQDGGVVVTRLDDPDLSYRQSGGHLRSLARQTHDRVRDASRVNIWVTPVMVLWAEFPEQVVEGPCVYVHGDQLVAWLRSRPLTLPPSRVLQVASLVRESWISEADPA